MPGADARRGLAAQGLRCTRGGRVLFSNLGFEADPGALVQVRGSNGNGKSSLLRLLCGLQRPARGEVRWQGCAIAPGDAGYAGSLAYLGHASGLHGDLTATENLRFALALAGNDPGRRATQDVLKRLRLAHCGATPARGLSQGQRRRLALARVFLSGRPLWLLDEPHAGLDAEGTALLEERLAAHARDGGVAVVATHRDFDGAGRGMRVVDLDAA